MLLISKKYRFYISIVIQICRSEEILPARNYYNILYFHRFYFSTTNRFQIQMGFPTNVRINYNVYNGYTLERTQTRKYIKYIKYLNIFVRDSAVSIK